MAIFRSIVGVTLFGFLALCGCASVRPHPSPSAQYVRGLRLLRERPAGSGVPAGIRLIRQAAGENLAVAQDRIGLMYLYGLDVPANTARAIRWIHRAAERGAPAAQLQLGNLYRSGRQVPQSWSRAYYWYSIAAKPVRSDVHIENSAQVHAVAGRLRWQVAHRLSASARARIERRVARWQPLPSVPYRGRIIDAGDRAR